MKKYMIFGATIHRNWAETDYLVGGRGMRGSVVERQYEEMEEAFESLFPFELDVGELLTMEEAILDYAERMGIDTAHIEELTDVDYEEVED